MEKVLVIGGHGMLGRPVVRRLLGDGFAVRALARNVEKAQTLLPNLVEVVQGDLKDVESIKKAAEGVQAVYLNLETTDHRAKFQPEVDGVANVVKALEGRQDVVIAKLGYLGIRPTNGWFPNCDIKYQAEHIIALSGHPFLFFHPTWFMESLPTLIKNKKAVVLGRKWHPHHWISGDDLGRMVSAAFKNPKYRNRVVDVQGLEALDFDQALERYATAAQIEGLSTWHIPMFVMRLLAPFDPLANYMHRLFYWSMTEKEGLVGEKAWEELAKPKMKIEEYVVYMNETGDVPWKM